MMVVFSLALIAPWLSLEPEAKLPPCCRRDGKHGCAMLAKLRQRESSLPSFRNAVRCANYPTGDAIPANGKTAAVVAETNPLGTVVGFSAFLPPLETRPRNHHQATDQVRGPPAPLL